MPNYLQCLGLEALIRGAKKTAVWFVLKKKRGSGAKLLLLETKRFKNMVKNCVFLVFFITPC